MEKQSIREQVVRVLMHLNGGFTKVTLEWTEGSGLADGGITWDIPTDVIPLHLRMIGARFLLITQPVQQTHNGRSGESTLEVLELKNTIN